MPRFDVLINATPAGMRGNPSELPLDPDDLNARLVFDLVYNPLETPLLKLAAARGIETIRGIEMFIHQGARQFELWTNQPPPVDLMRQVVLDALTG
jgi:3-dehydroquinate dehydratase/shikimate dehydrogenase